MRPSVHALTRRLALQVTVPGRGEGGLPLVVATSHLESLNFAKERRRQVLLFE